MIVLADLREISLKNTEEFGEGASSLVYTFKDDESLILKLFNENVSVDAIESEFVKSKKMYEAHLPVPKAYEIVKVDNRIGIIYQRVIDKISFSRAMNKEPEKIEFYMQKFVKICKQLHSTEADTTIFTSQKEFYSSLVDQCKYFDDNEKAKVHRLLDTVEDNKTLVHGDMHTGNAIISGDREYWIDLGSAGYGSPIFDVSALCFLFHIVRFTPFTQNNFHLNADQLELCWRLFVKNYYNIPEEEIDKKTKEISKYIIFFLVYGFVALGIYIPADIELAHKVIAELE